MSAYKVAVSEMALDKKMLPGDPKWKQFNASFKNLEVTPGELANHIYAGRAITTWHKDNWRVTGNYICGQHIGLDFDNEDKESTLEYLQGEKFISRYASFIHTTMSHTDDKPRARVVFLLDSPIYQAKNYGLAASALLWAFCGADRQCKDAVRFFYGAPLCKGTILDNVLPLEVVKRLIANYQATGNGERKRASRPDYLPPASQQEVASALGAIDPWRISYDDWVSVLMAIHSQFGEGGYALAENWAQGKEGEVSHKWRSFKQDGNASGAVTIATLFGIAKRFGWNGVVNG